MGNLNSNSLSLFLPLLEELGKIARLGIEEILKVKGEIVLVEEDFVIESLSNDEILPISIEELVVNRRHYRSVLLTASYIKNGAKPTFEFVFYIEGDEEDISTYTLDGLDVEQLCIIADILNKYSVGLLHTHQIRNTGGITNSSTTNSNTTQDNSIIW